MLKSSFNIIARLSSKNAGILQILRKTPKYCVKDISSMRCTYPSLEPNLFIVKRYKHKKSKRSHTEEEEEETDEEDKVEDLSEILLGAKILETKVSSLRVDAVLKVGLGTSRSKVDAAFYSGDIRLNGEKVLKKSVEVAVEDEIDHIHSRHIDNPKLLIVSRIKLLSMHPSSLGFKIRLSRDKMLIHDYAIPWHG